MGRKKLVNAKRNLVFMRLDDTLYEQLRQYSARSDNSMPSVSARKALIKFLEEAK